MKKGDLHARVDSEGRLVLPEEAVRRLGLAPGDQLPVSENEHSILLRRPASQLAKLYIEPTSQCNLTCRICLRNTWEDPPGRMDGATFERIIEGLRFFSPAPDIVFGGFGEPLLHPAIATMVARAKSIGSEVSLITNGTLLSKELSFGLAEAGLDVLWVSLDGSTEESYGGVRPGAVLDDVVSKVIHFRTACWNITQRLPHIGIVFVAMKRTIADLPEILRLGRKLLADRLLITNVLSYTEELCDEVLYNSVLSNVANVPSPWLPQLTLARIDLTETTREPLYRIAREWQGTHDATLTTSNANNYCPFIERGAAALCWDGNLSPCLPLLHSHTSYLNERKRSSRRYPVGNVNDQTLQELWLQPGYVAFRERVQSFQFSPCSFCGGCDLSRANEEDCFGNSFPTCGGCLWAQGVIRCP